MAAPTKLGFVDGDSPNFHFCIHHTFEEEERHTLRVSIVVLHAGNESKLCHLERHCRLCISHYRQKKHQRISPLPICNHLPLYTGAISLCMPCDIRRKVRPTCKNATGEVYRCGQAIARCFHDWRDQPTFFAFDECMALGESESSLFAFDIVLSSFLYNPYIRGAIF